MSCGKIEYSSAAEALKRNLHLNHRKHAKKHRYAAYYCHVCDCYHLTTITKKRKPDRKEGKYPFRYNAIQQSTIKNKNRKNGKR